MKRGYIDIPEGQMHYRWSGKNGQAVILLHMSGSSSDEFEQVGDLLASQGFQVYAPDLLGFGCSDPPPRCYTLDEHAGTIAAFMDCMGLEQAIVYGNLATANMAVHIGVNCPGRVSGLFLAHPLHSTDPVQYAQKRFLPEYSVIKPQSDGSHLLELWSRAYKYGESPQICELRCRCLHAAGDLGETLHWALFQDTPLAQLVPKLTAPCVIVAYASFRDPQLLEQVAALIPGGKYDLFSPGTPYITRSNPRAVVDMFLKYFSDQPSV